jgi:hypothetical protein
MNDKPLPAETLRLPEPCVRVRPLATSFRQDGFNLDLVERIGHTALYRKTKPCIGYVGYEVVKVLDCRPHPFDKDKELYDSVERYPASAEWGTYGWTFQTLEGAKEALGT